MPPLMSSVRPCGRHVTPVVPVPGSQLVGVCVECVEEVNGPAAHVPRLVALLGAGSSKQ